MFQIKDPMYEMTWHVQFGGPVEKARKQFTKKTGLHTWDVGGEPEAIFTSADDYWGGLLWFFEKTPDIGVIAHECSHATFQALRKLDAKMIDENTEEVFAYYIDFLIKQVTKRIKIKI